MMQANDFAQRFTDDALKNIVARFEKRWQADVQAVIDRLYELVINRGLKVDHALRILSGEYPRLFRLAGLEDALVESAAYGYGIMPSVLTSADRAAILAAVSQPWSSDELKLSDKLHSTQLAIRETIRQTVETQINRNATISELARELYDGYNSGKDNLKLPKKEAQIPKYMRKIEQQLGMTREESVDIREAARKIDNLARNGAPTQPLKAAYNQLMKAVESGEQKALDKAMRVAVEEKARYIADRIARTEMARAYNDGFMNRYANDPDAVAVQYKLSTRHPAFDICNMYADCDMYGLGAGIYPKDKVPPVPTHPHCLCKFKVLFKNRVDISKAKNRTNEALVEWFDKIPERDAKRILGTKGYTAYKAVNSAYNKRKAIDDSSYKDNPAGTLIRRDYKAWQEPSKPQYRSFKLNLSLHGLQNSGNNAIIKEILGKDFSELQQYIGKLDSYTVRLWYIDQDKNHIYEKINQDLPMEQKARLACELRIEHRKQARLLMADKKEAEHLDNNYPSKTFEQLLKHKMEDKGLTYEEAIKDIYRTASKTNAGVNKVLGLGDLL